MKEATITDALKQHVPDVYLDETLREYLVQLLQDDEAYEEMDDLIDAVSPFLDDDRDMATTLVQALAKERKVTTPIKQQLHPTPTPVLPAVAEQEDTASSSSCTDEEDEKKESLVKSRAAMRKEQRRKKKQQRKGKKGASKSPPTSPKSESGKDEIHQVVARLNQASAQELNEMDDYSSAWKEAKEEGRVWGGRGFGGRGVNRGLASHKGKDAVVHALTLSYGGRDLLQETHLAIVHGHRYGLMGPNGVGKSTLLRRIATGSVPGWPLHLSVEMVEQEVLGVQNTVVECMQEAKTRHGPNGKKKELEDQVAELEAVLEQDDTPPEDMEAAADRLSEIYDQLEALEKECEEADGAFEGLDARATTILKGLQFKKSMLETPMNLLSGGWRMRLALAQALYSEPDILLLDEPTNHLDLSAIMFLESYIVDNSMTVVVVSHDGHFLDAVCTDMIKFEGCKLKYHVGNYTSFRDMEEQAWARNTSRADAVARQEKKAKEFINKQRSMANSKHRDDNKQKQAAERKKKLGRLGLYAENGQKFKLLAEGNTKKGGSNRAGHIFGNYTNTRGMTSAFVSNEQVAFGEERQLLNFKFPSAAPLKGGASGGLITMEDCYFKYDNDPDAPWLLEDMSVNVSFGSRIAIVGKNGAGKSTLLKIMSGDLQVNKGEFHRHPNVKVAHIAQHHIEHLGGFLESTPVEYFLQQHNAKNEYEARQFLGQFGLVGPLALQLIGTLSGGQKARLAFATVMFTQPHVLVLDEPTNHLDRDSLESLSVAVDKFEGAVVIVSHNQHFMSQCTKEMWTVKDGRVKVQVADGEVATFDDLFEEYKESLRKEMKKQRR